MKASKVSREKEYRMHSIATKFRADKHPRSRVMYKSEKKWIAYK